MRNPDLPKLLRARRFVMQSEGLKAIYEQAAVELEKLEKIYKACDTAGDPIELFNMIEEILNGQH